MPSLTSLIPLISPFVAASSIALYERQRALVRLGLLPKPTGRGRGSGAIASAEHVALLLISMLATDSLSEMDGRIRQIVRSECDPDRTGPFCPVTSQRSFLATITSILDDADIAAQVVEASVGRQQLAGAIWWKRPQGTATFFRARSRRSEQKLYVTASLPGAALVRLGEILRNEGAEA